MTTSTTIPRNSTPTRNTAPGEPPTMRGHFLLGILPEFRRDPVALYTHMMHEYGDFVRAKYGPTPSYHIFHPDYVQRVLVDNNRNYKRNEFGNSLLKLVTGENVLTSDGEFWRRQRRLMQPAFHRKRILGFGTLMTESAQAMLDRWAEVPATQILDVDQEMMRVTLRIVGLALFGTDLTEATSALGHSITASSEYFAYRLAHLFAPPLWVPTRRNRAFKRAVTRAATIVPNMVAARRKQMAEHGSAEESGRDYDMMDLLLDARYEDTGEGMDDEQLAAEIRIMIGAGHETTAQTLSWTLYLLSEHPDVETRLHREVDEVLAGRVPTIDDLASLPYTRMVLDESMRLYPAAWTMARQSIGEDRFGPYRLPADAGVIIPIHAVHRHPAFWPDADRFDPDRFDPARAKELHRFAHFPFGGGPRQCIGNLFAITEAHLILAMIAQRYRLRLQPGHKVEHQALISLRVKNGLPMTLERR